MTPRLLDDKSRLAEIYNLRVEAWQHSHNSKYVNKTIFPDGWYDDLDNTGFHWIITDISNRIIGSARFNIVNDIVEIPNGEIFARFIKSFPSPLGFFSKLVIHPDFRKNGLSSLFDLARIDFIKQSDISLTLLTCDGVRTIKLLKHGFSIVGQDHISFIPNTKERLFADFMALRV